MNEELEQFEQELHRLKPRRISSKTWADLDEALGRSAPFDAKGRMLYKGALEKGSTATELSEPLRIEIKALGDLVKDKAYVFIHKREGKRFASPDGPTMTKELKDSLGRFSPGTRLRIYGVVPPAALPSQPLTSEQENF